MKKFFVTTPIYYINDVPSVGSAYTTIIADVIARWHRLLGEEVFYLTGLDENASKTVEAAKKQGFEDIQAYSNSMAGKWIKTWKNLNISFDRFIRTTEEQHKKVVTEFFMKVFNAGDIFKGNYKGFYCKGCEAFLMELDLVKGKCPLHKKAPEEISEENYFFKLSKYQDRLLKLIEENPEFVQPEQRRNEIINFIKSGLKDLSISRPNLEWGINVPIDSSHKIWVWFDALVNYVSGDEKKFWPADLHIVGKDIQKFHCIQWPAMLMSAGYKIPKTVYSHGFLTVNGQKMSKSLGNVVDPNYLTEIYGVDALRYFLVREIPFGQDGNFSETGIIERLNNELANDLGNLVSRVLSLIEKNGENIPAGKASEELQKELHLEKIKQLMQSLEIHNALSEIWHFINACNKFVNEKEPWKLKGKELDNVLYSLADSIKIIAILVYPVMPSTSEKICEQLGVKLGSISDCKFNSLKAGTKISKGEILFKKLDAKQLEEKEFPWLEFEKDSKVNEEFFVVQVNGLNVQSKSMSLERFKKDFFSKIDATKISKSLHVEEYRKNLGEKDRGELVSVDNLLQQFQESSKLPNINTVTDCYNLKSLEYGLVIGAYDRKKVFGKVFLRKAIGQEKFTPVGSQERVKIFPGEIILVDSNKEVITRWLTKQSEVSKVNQHTRSVLMCFMGNSQLKGQKLKKIVLETLELIIKFCGGKYKFLN